MGQILVLADDFTGKLCYQNQWHIHQRANPARPPWLWRMFYRLS